MADLTIYRTAVQVATVSIDEKTVLTKRLMGGDRITANFFSKTIIPVEIGDYVTFEGRNYYINQLPSIEKVNDASNKYEIVFEGDLYTLFKKLLISSDGLTDFSYTGAANEVLTFIVDQINTIDPGWTVGTVDDTEKKTFEFLGDTCRSALTKIAQGFNFEFKVNNKTIDFQEAVGTLKAYTFEYGKNKGLYSITRRTVENDTLFTRVYGYGGTKNIPYTYRNRAKRLVFEERYLDKNIDKFGLKEGRYTNDDIYPKRTATLTAINILFSGEAYNVNDSYIEDNTLDFDINQQLAEGLTPKIVFKSGDLSGYQFEIWKYDNANKRIYFNPFNETDGYVLPSTTLKPQVGDTYTLVDLKMPTAYIRSAEAELKAATQAYLDEQSVPKSLYLVKIDPKKAKTDAVSLDSGDLVTVVDAFLGIDRAIRVAQITYPLVNVYKIEAIIADFIPYSLQERIAIISSVAGSAINNLNQRIENITNNIINNTTQNVTNTTIINENGVFKIRVFDKLFTFEKGFDNTNPEKLEAGDFIMDNWYNRYVFVTRWQYLGADDLPQTRNLRANWDELETLDNTP